MEFTNGDTIEYLGINLNWIKGKYVGKNPECDKEHVILNQNGHVRSVVERNIRKPKVKKEGWVNIYPPIHPEGIPTARSVFESEEMAKVNANPFCIGRSKVEWYE